jgi:RHH-type rel operon transcriptional repressor/antitoxin RelB
MDPLLEKQLELAVQRRGITKSQFIIDAVERALGRKDPAALYRKVMQEAAQYKVNEPIPDDNLPTHKAALRQILRAEHARHQDEYAAYVEQRKAAPKAGEGAAD